jgi:PAS domain S-box-containing protein
MSKTRTLWTGSARGQVPLRKVFAWATIGILMLIVTRTGTPRFLFSGNYLPHRYCYLAQPDLIWTNVILDSLIAASYVVIFTCLFWVVARLRSTPQTRTYLWVFVAFGVFIVACASTHFMEVVTIWWPVYRLSVAFKLVCAVSSVATAVLFTHAAPKIIASIRQFLETLSQSQRDHATDMMERVKAQGQVKNTEARLQAILDGVLDSIITIDANGIIVSVNPAVAKTFEYAAEELVGHNVKMLMPEPNRRSHDGHLARYQSTGTTKAIGVGRELEGLTKTGQVFPMELTITELSLDGQRLFVGLVRDISERVRAEAARAQQAEELARQGEELVRSQHEIRGLNEDLEARIARRTAQLESAVHELESFSYSVSHHLRAPLRHIGGFSKILVKDFGSELVPEARAHLQRIESAIIRMGLLVDDLLGYARLGRQRLRLHPTDMNALVAQVILKAQPECEGREVEWRVAHLPEVVCDAILMGQVWQNLLSNALKYSRGRTRALIEIGSMQQMGAPVVLFVRDNGAGFDMNYAQRLFGVFERMDAGSEFEGTGVGLATVQRIIQKHGGRVWAEAEPDHGATFYFTLSGNEGTGMAPQVTAVGTQR